MSTSRVEAFSDGVMAILITIMVLELRTPESDRLNALRPLLPVLVAYLLSFLMIGIYWTNHHHLFQAVDRVNGAVLWANLHLLFWLSLLPFGTAWLGRSEFAPVPATVYGCVLFMAAVAYYILVRMLLHIQPASHSHLREAIGRDLKGTVSAIVYLAGVAIAPFLPWVACGLYVVVAFIWVVPDLRISRELARDEA